MIDKKTVQKIANLARLKLTDEEIAAYAEQMDVILKTFERLSAVDTTNVEPLVNPIEFQAPLRADEPRPSLGAEEMLKNAPEREGHLFKVPPVV